MEKKRKVIITGGSRGIGAACVRRFCAAGDDVVFIYRENSAAAGKISEETGARHIKYNLSGYNNSIAAAAEALSMLGGCDVLVNAAGIAQIKLYGQITQREWRTMIDTNLSSVFALTQRVSSAMIAAHSGRIVNIGSVWGGSGASCEVHYSASKSALRGFTSALAKELGPSGITVNCVEPGVIDTDMNRGLTDEVKDSLREATPLCRLGTPEEVSSAVFFLASEEASFITGAILPVDGGFRG